MRKELRYTNILRFKSKLLLTIYGSYDKQGLLRLNELRNCLTKKGYTKTALVLERPYPTKNAKEDNDQYFLRKSIYWLENSDACIFVFFNDLNNEGVVFELKHVCDRLEDKLSTCLVVIESRKARFSTSLIRGTITNLMLQRKMNRRFFDNDAQLCRFCGSAAISFLKIRAPHILERT